MKYLAVFLALVSVSVSLAGTQVIPGAPDAGSVSVTGMVGNAAGETTVQGVAEAFDSATLGGSGSGTAVNTIHCKDAMSWLTRTPQPGTTNALDAAGNVVYCWNGIDGDASQAKYAIRPWQFNSVSGNTYVVTGDTHASGDASATNVALCLILDETAVATGSVVNTTGMDATNYKTYQRQHATSTYTAQGTSFSVYPIPYAPSGTNGQITIYDSMTITISE